MLTLLTAYTPNNDWDALAGLVLQNLTAYAERHGYALDVLRGGFGDPSMQYPFQKIAYVRDWMDRHADGDLLWVLDIDLLITNLTLPVASFLDETHHLFMGREINGMNSGSFILRTGSWAKSWCDEVLSMFGIATGENHAICLMHESSKWSDETKEVEGINSIPYERYPTLGAQLHHSQWKPGHLIYHLPGMTPQDRFSILSSADVQAAILQ